MNMLNTTTMQSLANFTEERLPCFMVISLEREPNSLMALSPRIMHWYEDVWLIDLQVSVSYWRVQALQQGISVMDVIRTVLEHAIAAENGFYRAALADHPWQAVLLFEAMKHRTLSGVLKLDAAFGGTIYREISWSTWWASALNFAEHCERMQCQTAQHTATGHGIENGREHRINYSGMSQYNTYKFNAPNFRSRCSQMQRAMKRLGVKTPWGLCEMEPLQIKRRFGKSLHDLCQWAFHQISISSSTNMFDGRVLQRSLFGQECDFPWVSFASPEQPKVSCHLDFPLTEWEQISPILCSDLDRLCNLENFKVGERVVSLEWRIVFQDLSYLVIPIKFRHPHSLHQEMTRHCTALLQALYAFESSLRGSPLDKARWDELIPIEPIVSWSLAISERLVLPDQLVNIFGGFGVAGDGKEASALFAREQELLAIENRLPVALESYELRHDPLPEDSYAVFNKENSYEVDVKAIPTLTAQAQNRPLFVYREPIALESSGGAVLGAFTERTLDKWWRTNEDSKKRPLQRDYFRMITKEEKALWVFRDNAKHSEILYIHGIFA